MAGPETDLEAFRQRSLPLLCSAGLGGLPSAVVGGLCTLGVVGGWMLAFKTLRTVDRFEEAAQASS